MRIAPLALAVLCIASAAAGQRKAKVYQQDIEFALAELGKQCRDLLRQKGIDWKRVAREFKSAAKKVATDQDHLVLLARLVARLRDGHAAVKPLELGKDVRWPDEPERTGPGLFLCRIGDGLFVKNAWGDAEAAGVGAGMEVLEIDGEPAAKWLAGRIESLRDRIGFSTDQHAESFACHWGLADPVGTRRKLALRTPDGATKSRTLTYRRASAVAQGPAFFPPDLDGDRDVRWGKVAGDYGYIHVRRCPGDLPSRIDRALAALDGVPGLVLDLRGNGGGGFDHEALMGRFVPAGKTLAFAKRYASAGDRPYGGPVVVLVDGNVRSAGETLAAIFKEDGRGYLIGESPTAGMSAQKATIELPSGLFALYVAVRSNMARSNGGRGIEGIGVPPHEVVEFDAADLAAGRDTLIERAGALLADFPQKAVPYDPADFGWSAGR